MEIIKQLESLLFSSGKAMAVEELAKLCKSSREEVKEALTELKRQYTEKQGSLMVVDEGDFWKITVREDYVPLVSKIVTETELSKTITETLAVIAWKAPVLQSKVIGIRTNKAYDHLTYLEEAGYITREKHGRTKMIKLGQKFFEYFDLPSERFKERFVKFEDMEKTIVGREKEARAIAQAIEDKKEEHKKQEEKKAELSEEEHKKLDEDIEKLEKAASGIVGEHETTVQKRTDEEYANQEWKAIRLRKKKEEAEVTVTEGGLIGIEEEKKEHKKTGQKLREHKIEQIYKGTLEKKKEEETKENKETEEKAVKEETKEK